MKYKMVFGDWSGDGHGKTETLHVEVPDTITQEMMKENYEKNKQRFGFGYNEFASDYEENRISAGQVEVLTDAGLTFVMEEEADWDTLDYKTPIISQRDDGDYYLGGDYVIQETLLPICMFMIGDGIPGWQWETIDEKLPELLGGYGAVSRDFAGYGLFY